MEEGRKLMGAHMPSHHTIKIFNFDFFEYFDQVPKCPNLAFKCYYDAFLAKYCLMGAPIARLMVKVAPGVKMLLRA